MADLPVGPQYDELRGMVAPLAAPRLGQPASDRRADRESHNNDDQFNPKEMKRTNRSGERDERKDGETDRRQGESAKEIKKERSGNGFSFDLASSHPLRAE